MDINFALPYQLKFEDQVALLTEDERQRLDQEILDLIEQRGVGRSSTEARVLAVQRRQEFLNAADPVLRSRLTAALLASGIAAKYERAMPRREGRAWARVQDAAEDRAVAGASVEDALWLVSVFIEPRRGRSDECELTKVWDAYPPSQQRFLDPLEAEVRRLAGELRRRDDEAQTKRE